VSYAVAGYAITFGVLVAYSWRVITRGRRLARTLPAEERTWR
jgi:hypothetical protein